MFKTTLIGHIGKDAAVRHVNGVPAVNFSVAHTESYKNRDGVKTEKTTWIDCTYWEKEKLAPYLTKGTLVCVEGEVSPDSYEREGKIVNVLRLRVRELTLLSGTKKKDDPGQLDPDPARGFPPKGAPAGTAPAGVTDDLPF